MSEEWRSRRPELENRLLKSLSQPSSRAGLKRPAPALENKLLAKLTLKSSLRTKRSRALPLCSSILLKHEAKQQAAISKSGAPTNLFLAMDARPANSMRGFDMFEGDLSSAELSADEEDDDMGMGMCYSDAMEGGGSGFSFGQAASIPLCEERDVISRRHPPPTGSNSLFGACKMSAPKKKKMAFRGVSFGASDENWAMPDVGYDFKKVDLSREFDDHDAWPELEERTRRAVQRTRATKLRFLNTVCVSLVSQTNLRAKEDAMRCDLIQQAKHLAKQEPEFILKVALYARQELYIRTTANFLLSLAAWLEPCRPFLRKYYAATIRLPTDWIEVSELYQVFDDSSLNFGSLPASLRKVMVDKFPDFDDYQLAKYNRAKKKKGKPAEPAAAADLQADDDETEDQRERRCFTIKQLVRLLHVKQPAQHVMAIVGKKYPADPDAFRRSGLPGMFDSTRCNVRMRLPTPETWETQVAQRGNKAEVWRDLIDHKKLPYMAMLRNIRNMILAGIGAVHHDKVLKTLTNESAVRNSKQMAFRYLSAYAALDDLVEMRNKDLQKKKEEAENPEKTPSPPNKRAKEIWWSRRQRALKARKAQIKYDLHVIDQYRSALDRAVAIATVHNVPPIAGRTLLFCDISEEMDAVCASAKGFGKPKTARTMAVLLSLMCQRSSESSELVCLRGYRSAVRVPLDRHRNLLKQTDEVEQLIDEEESSDFSGSDSEDESEDQNLGAELDRCLAQKRRVDTIVMMGTGRCGKRLHRTLELYRQLVNPNLLFVNVDLTRPGSLPGIDTEENSRNVKLHGFSDQILRFVAERGTSGQLAAVDNIDVKYKLRRDIRLPAIDLRETILASESATAFTRWRTVRVFISSTFLDMHGERDLLIRHVMPELRTRARALRIDLQVVDLRWGITAQQADENKQLELCLSEIDRCQLFVGLLGARYGQALSSYPVTKPHLVQFVAGQREQQSLTALEMLYATRQPERQPSTAVFYQRDDALLRSVPGEVMSQFADLAAGRRQLANLRVEIESRGCRVHSYTATYGGVVGGRPVATGLQQFGEGVMETLWNTMQTMYPVQASSTDLASEEYTLQHQFATDQSLVGRRSRLSRALEEVHRGQGRYLLVSGKPGNGKTCFLAKLYSELVSGGELQRLVVPVFCGAGHQCGTPAGLLAYLRALLARQPLQLPADGQLAQLGAELAELLAVRARRQHVVLVLDGLETLWTDCGAAAAHWLPEPLPQNVTVVVSADDGSALYKRINSLPRVLSISLGPLELSERSALVRHLLEHHSKTLDESAWNNQLRTLTSKRGAGDPLYLKMACEELRTFGLFEKVSVKLAALGQTVSALTQDIIQRLEDTYGAEPVRLCLCAVALSQHGMTEDDLLGFLKRNGCRLGGTTDQPLTRFTFTSMLRSGESLVHRWSAPGQPALLRLAHAEMARVVRSRYLAGPQADSAVRELAQQLAEYFEASSEESWPAPPSVLMAMAHFWGVAEDMFEYRRVVCSLSYLTQAAESGMTAELPSIVSAAGVTNSSARKQYLQHPHVQQTTEFLRHNLHLITRNPGLMRQQALNEPSGSYLQEEAELLVRSSPGGEAALVRLTHQYRQSVAERPHCTATLRLDQAVTAAVADPEADTLFAGLSGGGIKMLELGSGREVRAFAGHAEPVTGLVLLSQSQYLVSGCAAGQLSVWSPSSGQRLTSTDAHRRRITALAARPDTNEFVTVAWSCDLKLWMFRPGSGLSSSGGGGAELQQLRVLTKELQPLSCVAHHPTRPLVATGGWDAKLKIWDTTDMQRKAVRHGHGASVRCVAISPDAHYIVSGDMDGQLLVWGTRHGEVIQRWKVHQGAVHAVCYLSEQRFVTAGADGDVKIWCSHVGAEVGRHSAESAVLLAVAFCEQSDPSATPGAASVLTVTADGVVSARRASGGSPLWTRRLQNVTAAACDGRRAYLAAGRAVMVLSLSGGATQRQLSTDAPVTSITCLPGSAPDALLGVVYMGLEDGRIGVGLADRGDVVTSLGHSGQVTSLAATMVSAHPLSGEDAEPQLASGGRDGMVLVWGAENEYTSALHAVHAYAAPVSAVAWFQDKLVTAGQNSELHVYDCRPLCALETNERRLLTGNSSPVCSLRVQGTHMLSTSTDGQVLMWTSALVAVTEQRCRSGSPADLTHTAGSLVALLPQDDAVQLMDMQKMSCVSSFGDHLSDVSSVSATKQGLLSASLDGSAKVWNVLEGTVASTDAGVLAMRRVGGSAAGVTSHVVVVSRDARVQVYKWGGSAQLPPELVYTAQIKQEQERETPERETILLAAVGPATVDSDGALTLSAVVTTASGGCRVSVTVDGSGAGSHQLRWWRCRSDAAPPLCLTADGYTGCPLVGDADGRVSVSNAELQPHAVWHCGAGDDPAIALMTTLDKTVVTCDRNGMLCRVQQTPRLNAINVQWEAAVPFARTLAVPDPTECQLKCDSERFDDDEGEWEGGAAGAGAAPMDTDSEIQSAAFPTALLAAASHPVLGDAAGRLWWKTGDRHHSQQAHSGEVRWLGRDAARQDILYSSGADRRFIVWRTAADGTKLQQVGEFEFPSRVSHCVLLPAPSASQPTSLLCGDDRGRLHCLQVDLSRVAAPADSAA